MNDNYNSEFDIIQLKETDSTNNFAKRLIEERRQSGEALSDCTIISADRQTAGRGRQGKSFASPGGGCIYMTIVMKADEVPERCMMITPAAAVGTLLALEEAGSGMLGIKWVNDLFLKEKKVCGILTEAVFAKDGARIEYVVIGIGINIDLDMAQIPEDVRAVAGTIRRLKLSKQDMVLSIARHVRSEAEASISGETGFMSIYRERSVLTGREVFWEDAGGRHVGKVTDINDRGNLIVSENGNTVTLMSGEGSVRKL